MSLPTPVYVINLPESEERRSSIDSQARELGFVPTYFAAIDGRHANHPLFSKVDERKRLRYKGRPFKPGELGVWASHYLLWEECVRLDTPIVILEDDALLKANFPDFLRKAGEIAAQFPYLRLYESSFPSKPLQTLEGFQIHRYRKNPLRTTGYLLAPEAARKFLGRAGSWVLPVDDYMDLPWLHGVDCLGLRPGCVEENTHFASTIQTSAPKERLGAGHKLARELFRSYLRIRYRLDYIRRSF